MGNLTSVIQFIYKRSYEDYVKRLDELRDPHIIYVTDLASCTHKYYLRTQYPELLFRFEPVAILGEMVHAGLESILEKEGFEIEYEVSKQFTLNEGTYTLKGRIDAYNRSTGVVVEIKTSRSSQGIPREHHLIQLQIYLNMVNASKGILLYITPDRIAEYDIERQDLILEDMMKNLINDNMHPRWDWECRYCIFSKMCPYRINKVD
ncbi:MAG: CRISPR-associated protein Cas4 [Desulfurococcales archaeon]|nr:CRISPR-associated protein Cas4 [Desulfurococcales archaeon]